MGRRKKTKGFKYIRKKVTHLYKNMNYGDKVEVYFFKDLIELDNFGNLFVNGRVRKGESTLNGYLKNGIMTTIGKKVNFKLHCAVGQVFIKKDMKSNLVVNHKNSDKTDNNIENLEWITKSENIKHGINLKRKKENKNNLTFNFGIISELSKAI